MNLTRSVRFPMSLRSIIPAAAALVTIAVLPVPGAGAAPSTGGDRAFHLYAHGFVSDQLVGFSATDTGAVRRIPGTVSAGLGSWPQVASPDGRRLLGASALPTRLTSHTIGADGALTAVGRPVDLPDVPIDIVFAPDGARAYVLVGVANTRIVQVSLDPSGVPRQDGAPVPLRGVTDGISSATISPDGRNLYVASYFHDELVRIPVRDDGRVDTSRQARFRTGSGPIYPAMTADGRRLYVANERGNSIEGFTVAPEGTLTRVPGSPFPVGMLPHVMSITPDGRYLYMPNQGSEFLSAFAIRPDGSLRPMPDVPFGNGLLGAKAEATVISPSGRSLWALGPDPLKLGSNVLRRYHVRPDGGLMPDRSVVLDTGTLAASGRSLTVAR